MRYLLEQVLLEVEKVGGVGQEEGRVALEKHLKLIARDIRLQQVHLIVGKVKHGLIVPLEQVLRSLSISVQLVELLEDGRQLRKLEQDQLVLVQHL